MTAILLQSVTSVITKCDRYYKVQQFYYKVRQVLQSAMIIRKCDRTRLLYRCMVIQCLSLQTTMIEDTVGDAPQVSFTRY